MSTFQPPPTWALPIVIDEKTKQASFSPIWLKWFIELSANLSGSGVPVSGMFGPGSSTRYSIVLWDNTLGTLTRNFANLGTTTTVLHGNASGVPSWAAIVAADAPTLVPYTGATTNLDLGSFKLLAKEVVAGEQGSEGTGISINGTTIAAHLRVSDINNSHPAEFILHRHSNTLGSTIYAARSHSNGNSHGNVVDTDVLFTLYMCGWTAASTYNIGATIRAVVDGTPGADDLPTSLIFATTADGANTSTDRVKIKPTGETQILTESLVLPKTSGVGIKVEPAAPTWGWRDILGQIITRGMGVSDPDWVVYRGTLYGYTFTNAAHAHEAWLNYHIPHDYVPGTDLYIHVHWSQKTVDTGGPAGVPGVAKWYFDISYADGHGTAGGAADPFVAPITQSVTQQGSTTQYGHMIAEVAFTNDGGDATHLDRNTIQVDGLILVRIYRDSGDAADTLNQDPFVHMVDIHYQSSNMATKNKAPNFYS